MPQTKWKSFAKANSDKEYLALISYLPLKSFLKLPAFLSYTLAVQSQLKQSRGIIGYSLLAHLSTKEFWTLSVWEDEGALAEFVRSGAHKQTMLGLRNHLGETRFIKWKIKGSTVPPMWEDALSRLS